MPHDTTTRPALPSLADLLRSSDFARANPGRASEILDRCADPSTEDRNSPNRREREHA